MTIKVSEAEFLDLWNRTGGSAAEVARLSGLAERSVHKRRRDIEARGGTALLSQSSRSPDRHLSPPPPGRINLDLRDGTVIVGSDAHIWPGELTTAQRAFVHFAKRLKPEIVVLNGDLLDGSQISRHPTTMWAARRLPTVREELEACQDFMHTLAAAHTPAAKVWLWGNHDMRFESRLTAHAPEYEGVEGFALKDHFPEWKMAMSLWVNESTAIKHRWHNGIHATYNNTLRSGMTMVTGHLHSLKVTPWTDYTGDRYGVDTGTLADVNVEQFFYTEDNPRNWRSGFAVLTFRDGKLLAPELVQVWDADRVQFRGELVTV